MGEDPYLQAVASLPPPTPEQAADFAEHVAGAHSWYKHLPLLPPGAPFRFFLDPNAGRVLSRTPNGAVIYHDRVEGWDRFHYSEMTTAEYRRRFGCWQYHCDRGTSFMAGRASGGWSITSTRLEVQDKGAWLAVPGELLQAGTCALTALVHAHFNPIRQKREEEAPRYKAWRAENPSAEHAAVYEALFPEWTGRPRRAGEGWRLEEMLIEHGPASPWKELRVAERWRQFDEMRAAMARVLALL